MKPGGQRSRATHATKDGGLNNGINSLFDSEELRMSCVGRCTAIPALGVCGASVIRNNTIQFSLQTLDMPFRVCDVVFSGAEVLVSLCF